MLVKTNNGLPAINGSHGFDPVIKDLLFFSNSNHPISGMTYSFVTNYRDGSLKEMENDPSIIWTTMEIQEPGSDEYVDTEIGYFPSYYRLESKQKYLYLKWLQNISLPAGKSFLLILLYCLERNIIMGNYVEAVDAILYLRKHHTEKVFMTFSLGSVIACAFYWNKIEVIKNIDFDKKNGWYWHNDELLYLLVSNSEIDSDDFIKLLLTMECSKFSYFKDKKQEYKICFSSVILEMFQKNTLFMNDLVTISQIEKKPMKAFMNYKIDDNARMLNIPNVIESKYLKESCKIIHENVKRRIKKI